MARVFKNEPSLCLYIGKTLLHIVCPKFNITPIFIIDSDRVSNVNCNLNCNWLNIKITKF